MSRGVGRGTQETAGNSGHRVRREATGRGATGRGAAVPDAAGHREGSEVGRGALST